MNIAPLGDAALLITVGDDVIRVRETVALLKQANVEGIREIVPAYSTVAVYYDPVLWAKNEGTSPFATFVETINGVLESQRITLNQSAARERIIPVCYGGKFGPDLSDLAASKNLAADEVIALHSGATYEVRAIGFSPGFPYLAGLPEALHVPRRASPRVTVPSGSVAIGGAQAGIYTLDTPGGWHILGRTPIRLFNPVEPEPALLQVGDKVRFVPITPAEFEEYQKQ
ncbi:MAG: 5-oxoprolinase subunit PxpB [Nibricoccus sp.]